MADTKPADWGDWCPYSVENAKSGRSTCKKCGSSIAVAAVRIGTTVVGEAYNTTSWQHLNCFKTPKTLKRATWLIGWDTLSSTDQNMIKRRIELGEDVGDEADDAAAEKAEAAEEEKQAKKKQKAAEKRKRAKKDSDDDDEDESDDGSAPRKRAPAKPKAKAAPKAAAASTATAVKPAEWDAWCPYGVEYSASGRAACRECGAKIGEGEMRTITTVVGEAYNSKLYHHLQCFTVPNKLKKAEWLTGYDELEANDKAHVRAKIEGTTAPAASGKRAPAKKAAAKRAPAKRAKKRAVSSDEDDSDEDDSMDESDDSDVKPKRRGKK